MNKGKNTKVAVVYTSTTPELIADVERNIRKELGDEVEIISFEDATVLTETRDTGYVTPAAAARLVGMFAEAIQQGADAILNACSSVGEVADSVQAFAAYSGVPIVRIDEEMCRDAVRKGDKIAVMATLFTTLSPTIGTVKRVSREINKPVEVVEALVEGAFGLDQEEFKERMLATAKEVASDVDCIIFAQGSMAYAEDFIGENVEAEIFSSPAYGARELRKALEFKGLL